MAQVCVLQPASENTENLFSENQNHTLEFLATHWRGKTKSPQVITAWKEHSVARKGWLHTPAQLKKIVREKEGEGAK